MLFLKTFKDQKFTVDGSGLKNIYYSVNEKLLSNAGCAFKLKQFILMTPSVSGSTQCNGGQYSIFNRPARTSAPERRVPELIPVLGSQPAGDVSHKPGGRLPLLSARSGYRVIGLEVMFRLLLRSKFLLGFRTMVKARDRIAVIK